MGRAPCCDKANVKKGPWSPEEDAKLKSYIQQHGTGDNWITLPQKIGLKRCGKSCRLRWLNYLRPNIKHGGFTEEEDRVICSLYVSIGSRWSVIAGQLPGRTDNDIKNYWNTKLKKKLLGKHRKEQQSKARSNKHDEITGKKSENSSSNLVCENSISISDQYILQSYCPRNIPMILPPSTQTNVTNQLGYSFNDQDSIKRMLVKLGGRFSHENDYYQPILEGLNFHEFPSGVSSTSTQQIHDEEQVQYLSQSQSFTTSGNNNYVQNLSELEFLYGDDMISGGGKSSNWGESSSCTSMIYPSFVASNYQGERPQDYCVFQELSDPREV